MPSSTNKQDLLGYSWIDLTRDQRAGLPVGTRMSFSNEEGPATTTKNEEGLWDDGFDVWEDDEMDDGNVIEFIP